MSCLTIASLLTASEAGRARDMNAWSFAENIRKPQVQVCAHTTQARPRELVFETVEFDPEEALGDAQMALAAREGVRFDWNPATGELSYDSAAPSRVFSDLVASAWPSGVADRSCGSH